MVHRKAEERADSGVLSAPTTTQRGAVLGSAQQTRDPQDTPCDVRWARFADLSPYALYGAIRLRVAVFAVEQHCVYQDLDGRDMEPATWHGWVEEDGEVLSYLRILNDPPDEIVGRVVTAPHARGRGLGRVLMAAALERTARPVRIEAQSYLLDWYGAFGFVPRGPEYLEDGIPHTPMVLVR